MPTFGPELRLGVALEGAETAAKKIENIGKEADETEGLVMDLSNSLDYYIEQLKQADKQQNKNKKSSDDLQDSLALKIVVLQGTTSALNQVTGAAYKFIGGLQASGVVTTEQAANLQQYARRLELITGPMEFGIALATLHATATEYKRRATEKDTGATLENTAAQIGLNTALLANPYVRVIAFLALFVGYLITMEYALTRTTRYLDAFGEALERIRETWSKLLEMANPFDNIIESESWIGKNRMNSQMGG